MEAILQSLPQLKAVLVCDLQGAILLGGGDEAHAPNLQRLAATFAQTTEQASKLGLGKNRHMTCFYEEAVVIHSCCTPLVLTMLATPDANVGLMLEAVPQLVKALEPLQKAVRSSELAET